ncbi:MAG: site-specific DNA-methyltransferase [Planctomycetes bacterium]|nr:site-specific DNA-methyltransferase [Planctomycetota bacterium]
MAAPRNRTLVLTDADRKEPVPALSGRPLPDRIYCGDALEGLKVCPPADLIFADPPYDAAPDWHGRWIDEAARALRPGGSIYVCCDWTFSGTIQAALGRRLTVRNRITWRREKGRGAKRNWKQNMEDIWFATKGDDYVFNLVKWKKPVIAPYRVNGKPKDWVEENGERYRMTHPSNIWIDLCVPFWSMPENTPHPYQKPEKLVERVIEASSRPGDLVVDPFLGSGTTAVVARRLKRSFLGFEIEPDHVRLALKRLAVRP